jgi:hypothetical protein
MKQAWRSSFLMALFVAAGACAAFAQAPSLLECKNGTLPLLQFSPCEVVIAQSTYTTDVDAYTIPDVKAVFTHKTNNVPDKQVTVHAFNDRDASDLIVYKLRFNPTLPGAWDYVIDCKLQSNATQSCGVTGASGAFSVTASSAKGFLRRDADHPTKFVYDDPSKLQASDRFHPFIWGQTYYQIVNQARGGYTADWQMAVMNSKGKGMNKIRLLVSSWGGDALTAHKNPESKAFLKKPDGSLDRDKLDLAHWRALDEVTSFLDTNGMIADLILFHDGDNTSSPYAASAPANPTTCASETAADKAQNQRYTRYVVARYAAFSNVIWTLSNEYQLVTGPSPLCNTPWTELGCIIRGGCGTPTPGGDPWFANGAFLRPLSNHNNIKSAGAVNETNPANGSYPCFEFFNAGWASHISLQTRRPNGSIFDSEAANPVLRNSNLRAGNLDPCPGSGSNTLPVISDEYYYIGENKDGSNMPTAADRLRHRQALWSVAASGGFGSTGSLHGTTCVTCPPTFYTTWVEEPHYADITAVTNFFGTILQDRWWQMTASTNVTPASPDTRVYGIEGPVNQFVVYAVRAASNTANVGKYNVTLGKGKYTHRSYDPRNTSAAPIDEMKKVTQRMAVQLVTPKKASWEDWAERIFPRGAALAATDETAWVWDALPTGAIPAGDYEGWAWIDDDPVPISDSLAHQSNLVSGMHQHYFHSATETLRIATGDVLYAYVYLDPTTPPTAVMLQWNDGTWEHRAYWGENQFGWGMDGSNSRRYMAPLPATGQWVRLEVPASSVGLENHTLNGMAFTLFGGKATWDEAGRSGPGASCDPGVLTLQPQPSQTIIPGASATLSVAVSGTGPFQYQFYEGPSGTLGIPIGISTATINTGPLTTTKQYWAQIVDNCVGVLFNSDTATVTVQCTAAPTITVQPATRITTPGQQTTLSTSGTQSVSYQWYQGTWPSTANPISGATSSALSVAPRSKTDYWARITNGCGHADTATATVCVLPQITAQPTPRTINPGQSTTLTVVADNPESYQWYIGNTPATGTPYTGGTGSSLLVGPSGSTTYCVRVTNSCGYVDSTAVTVTVAPPPPPQIARIQSVSVLANSQNSITARWTQPTQAGTFLVAVISGLKDPAALQWTAPAGWQLATVEEFSNVKLAIYYLANNAGARTAETFTVQTGYHDMTLYVIEYSGMMAVNPLDKVGVAGDFTNNGYVQTGFTANTVQPKELVITGLTTYAQTAFSVAPTDGYAEVYDQSVLFHLTTAMYEKFTTSTGTYGHSATVPVPAEWAGIIATFRAAVTN